MTIKIQHYMRCFLITVVFFMINTAVSHAKAMLIPGQWYAPQPISTPGTGAYPSISFTPNGEYKIFYSLALPAPEHMIIRSQYFGSPLGPETNITDTAGVINYGNQARSVGVHDTGLNTIDYIMLNKNTTTNILKTPDNGTTFALEKSYPNASGVCSSYLPSFTVHDMINPTGPLRAVYGYAYDTGIFGCESRIYTAQQTCAGTCTWPASGAAINAGATLPSGVVYGIYETGTNVAIVSAKGVFYSSNDGSTYTLLNGPNTTQDNLKASDMAVATAFAVPRLYLLRTYTYGPNGTNQHLVYHYSDNFGAAWSGPQPVILNASVVFDSPQIALSGTNPGTAVMVVVWKYSATPNLPQELKSVMSTNGGQTWTAPVTIASVQGMNKIADFNLTTNPVNGKFDVIYSVTNGSSPVGVYIVKNY